MKVTMNNESNEMRTRHKKMDDQSTTSCYMFDSNSPCVRSRGNFRVICAQFHQRGTSIARWNFPRNLETRFRIDRSFPASTEWTRTHLEGRVLRSDLREPDYVAEVHGHCFIILRWHLMNKKIL